MKFPASRGPQVERSPVIECRSAELESYATIDATVCDLPACSTHPVVTECRVIDADTCRRLAV